MTRHSRSRWLVFAISLTVFPCAVACEAILDFDRTPLQPIYEASVAADSTSSDGAKTGTSTSSSSSSGSTPQDANADSPSAPQDAGSDADASS